MPGAVRDRLRRWLVPFHYPGRNGRFMSALPRHKRRRYGLAWLTRPAMWAGAAGLMSAAIVAGDLLSDPHGWRAWAGGAVAVAIVGTYLLMHHADGRHQRRLAEADFPTHCRTCGYDRRGSPGPCPECGDDRPVSGAVDRSTIAPD